MIRNNGNILNSSMGHKRPYTKSIRTRETIKEKGQTTVIYGTKE
jgi:hypothetical protein